PSNKRSKTPGEQTINNILMNTVVPFIFSYGLLNGKQELQDKAIQFMEELPAENNSIIKGWRSLGIKAQHAYDSQALIQLKTGYCDQYKCLQCSIGNEIIKTSAGPE
ncbi:MAG: DUF2851 family protein, partial [Bacteroidetes bacterium]|nr:DUF2851 family protein [Bacteroidota bacterium]